MRKFLIALVILAVLLVVLDRAGLVIAQREIGSRVQSAYRLPARPGVSVRGFPFLTQVASGTYQQINVSIKSASAGGVQLENIDATFTGVHAPLSLVFGQSGNGVNARRERRLGSRDAEQHQGDPFPVPAGDGAQVADPAGGDGPTQRGELVDEGGVSQLPPSKPARIRSETSAIPAAPSASGPKMTLSGGNSARIPATVLTMLATSEMNDQIFALCTNQEAPPTASSQ